MNDTIISAAYTTFVNKGAMALLIGSGVSRESEIPTGWDITLDLVRQVGVLQGVSDLEDPETWYRDKFGESPDYSDLLETLTSTTAERINLLKPYFEPSSEQFEEGVKVPSIAHQHIAKLVLEGYIRVIITTNFDRLIENALKEVGIEPVIISNPNHIDNVLPLIHSRITLIKLNGDYLDTSFLNLKRELSYYDPRFKPLLLEVFENFGLITCGWSGKWDIGLMEVLQSSNKFRFTNYFTYRSKPSDELALLAQFRQAHLLSIANASTFFKELYENVAALEHLKNRHPLTEPVAIQRAKKYVARPENRVELADLTYDLSKASLESIVFDFSQSPTSKSIIENFVMCLSKLQTLSAVLAQTVYWSEPYHFPIWSNVMKMALNFRQQNQRNSYADWDNLLQLPATVIRYVIGISYVANKNWDYIRLLHEVNSTENSYKKNILKSTHPEIVVTSDHFVNTGYKKKTPVSLKLYHYLQPLFQPILSTDESWTEVFDSYEIISSLMYMKSNDGYRDFGPLCRFTHSNNTLWNEIKTQSEEQKDSYFMVAHGLFRSYDELNSIIDEYGRYAFSRALFL